LRPLTGGSGSILSRSAEVADLDGTVPEKRAMISQLPARLLQQLDFCNHEQDKGPKPKLACHSIAGTLPNRRRGNCRGTSRPWLGRPGDPDLLLLALGRHPAASTRAWRRWRKTAGPRSGKPWYKGACPQGAKPAISTTVMKVAQAIGESISLRAVPVNFSHLAVGPFRQSQRRLGACHKPMPQTRAPPHGGMRVSEGLPSRRFVAKNLGFPSGNSASTS